MRIHLLDNITVTLTQSGAGLMTRKTQRKHQANQRITMTIHEAMKTFGGYMTLPNTPGPIKPTIELDAPGLELMTGGKK